MDILQLLAAQHEQLTALTGAVACLAQTVESVTIGELWELFTAAKGDTLASWRDYLQRWRDHVGPDFGALDASAVGPSECDAYRAKRRAAGAATATINREVAQLRRLVNFGVKRGRVGRSKLHGPGMTVDLIHVERNVRVTVVEETGADITIGAFLAAATPMFRAFLASVYHSGMRRKEASLLRWERIDWSTGLAWIPDAETKGGTGGRYIPLSTEALAALEQLPRISPHVFANPRRGGRPFHRDHWTKSFRRLCDLLSLVGPDGPPWLHDLRRSFITLSRRRGETESDIMRVSAHKTRKVFDRYNAMATRDVIEFRSRAELAREELATSEIRGPRKGPQRATVRTAETIDSEERLVFS